LALFLFNELGSYAADPILGWDATLGDIWSQGRRVIIAYDHLEVYKEFVKTHIWRSVQQRWGNTQTWPKLETFLKQIRQNMTRSYFSSSRPVADMAELTPKPFDVFTDGPGGLRKMANSVNFKICQLYGSDYGKGSNIVAVDFYLSTNIIETAIAVNAEKAPIASSLSSEH